MASLDDVMYQLGQIQAGIDRLREDFNDEKHTARDSRAVIHKRLDEQARDIARLDTTVVVAGQVDAQMRDKVEELASKVEDQIAVVVGKVKAVEPSVEEWKRMKAIGLGLGGMLALGGLSIASSIAYFGEVFWNWLRHLLKIN